MPGLPARSQASRDWPPFQARVVKPRISTLTPQRSSVRARMSALIAATAIGRPRIDPELSISSETTVSRNSVSSSILNESEVAGLTTTRDRRAVSRMPSSRSNDQERCCCAISLRCSRLAMRPIMPWKRISDWSSWARRRVSSLGPHSSSTVTTSSNWVANTL